jgi:predicted phosphodiesterase
MPIHLPPISRRQFLGRTVAAAAGALVAPRLSAAEAGSASQTWALLSDIHIAADRTKIAREVNMTDNLIAVGRELIDLKEKPFAVLIDGDCAYNSGETGDYATVVDLLKPIREAQLPLHLTLGNHDDRSHFWDGLEEQKAVKRPVEDKHVALLTTPQANWILLDSLEKVLVTPGLLGEAQLDWLAKTLDANPSKPVIIAGHHNLAPAGETGGGLKDTEKFLEIIRPRKQVKAYIYGHTHTWKVLPDPSGIHLINLPPVAYLFDKTSPNGWVNATVRHDGLRLELRCLDKKRPDHGEVKDLKWRV